MLVDEISYLSDKLNVTILEDSEIERQTLRNLAEQFSRTRNEIHISDLVLCMRQSLFRKIKPVSPTVKQLGYFLDGSSRHISLQTLYSEGDVEGRIVSEKKGSYLDVCYSIDIFDDGPIEFKTTRANKAISEHWIRQLIYYMLITGQRKGLLQVQRIMPRKGENLFPAFRLELNDEQVKYWHGDFLSRLNIFRAALMKKDPAILPTYAGDGGWICVDCPYQTECCKIDQKKQVQEASRS